MVVNVPEFAQILTWLDLLAQPDEDHQVWIHLVENLKRLLSLHQAKAPASPVALAAVILSIYKQL